jgi:hypothetical protein
VIWGVAIVIGPVTETLLRLTEGWSAATAGRTQNQEGEVGKMYHTSERDIPRDEIDNIMSG